MHGEIWSIDLKYLIFINKWANMPFQFQTTPLQDLIYIIPQVFGDERGFFLETYHHQDFSQANISNLRVQDNHSKSSKGILRWLHVQTQHTQAKVVRVSAWSIYDVVVDLRPHSQTYGKRAWFELNASNKHMLYIPKWFAHGFLCLEDNTEFLYKCDDLYDPLHEAGIIRNDVELAIDREKYITQYHIPHITVSPKDQKNLTRKEFSQTYSHFV